MTKENILQSLSDQENGLLKIVHSVEGSMEDMEQELKKAGVFATYSLIHSEYLNLVGDNSSLEIKTEALKRGIFLNWYSVTEPICFTGLGDLNTKSVIGFYQLLENTLSNGILDDEFLWMLAYYSNWDYAILEMATDKMQKLASFVKSAARKSDDPLPNNLSIHHMEDRGLMGDYWRSVIESRVQRT